ncbi:TetR/AcrR family transcriptional regulator [Clostridium sp. HMP27]|uniref:TetR/AcrR family transcriptional regulator n=1 Tax=Clostridium sp. HMP27 TaxID=1487921 RepID=UPI00052B91AC|nr:TetR/AcrR family transcriptional regulator [Clostridium sp. HMP27]KGK89505.1 transcriptional regulator [Clostridium sp. HMP27]
MKNYNRNNKDIILSAAKDIAASQGITKMDIRSVAKQSGIAIGTVYNYFPSKGDLLVAVIEDFWEGAFSNVDWQGLAYNDFYSNLEVIYDLLYVYLHKFKENWLDQLSLLKTQEKLFGKQKQNEYFKKMYSRIITLMDMDNDLRDYPWNHIVSKERTAQFIFENMLMMLRKDEKDMKFLTIILKRILCN